MQRTALVRSLKAGFHPSRWGNFVALFLVLVLWRMTEGERLSGENSANYLLILLTLAYAYAVTPMPWQWTGDGRAMAPFPRGVLQSLLWNTLLLSPILFIPVLVLGPGTFLGKHPGAALPGWPSSGLAETFAIFGHALCFAMPVGWFLAREEANKAAKAESEAVQRTLEGAARQAQMLALQSQLDPHVLYNVLSGLSELIHEDPNKADEAVVSLSRLYRKLTALGRQDAIPLRQEREIIQDYLTVEQIRLGPRLRIHWDWDETLDASLVPPLLIQPLVENAIKHGLSPMEEGGDLRISLHAEAPAMRVRVSNNGLPLDPDRREGTGLANLQARLSLIGGGSSLHLGLVDGWTVADLLLKPREGA